MLHVYFVTDTGLQECFIFTIASYLNDFPRYLTVLLQVATDVNTENYLIIHVIFFSFIRTLQNSQHCLSFIYPSHSKTAHPVRTSARYTSLHQPCEVSATGIFTALYSVLSGPGSSVGIATGYGLDGRRIESRWGWDFPNLSRPALGSTQPPVQWVLGLSRG